VIQDELTEMLFGDKSRFAVEVRYDLRQSEPWLFGLFHYWVNGTRLGKSDYFNLTDIFYSMRRVFGDCGHREAKELCQLSSSDVAHWIKGILLDEDPRLTLEFPEDLPRDVARFNLMFHPANGPDWLFLLRCGDHGRLIYAAKDAEPRSMDLPIAEVEGSISKAYALLDFLNKQLSL
jgi:hypothetical protein